MHVFVIKKIIFGQDLSKILGQNFSPEKSFE